MNTSAISAISHHQWFWGPLWQAVNQGWLLTIHITNITKITLITSVFCRQWTKDGIDFAHYHHFQDYLDYQCFWQAVKQGWHWLCTLPSFPRLPWLPVFLADSESRMTIHITNISFIAWSSRCFFWRKNPLVTKITFITLITCFCQGIFSQIVLITTLPALPALPDYFSPKTLDSVPQDWPYLLVFSLVFSLSFSALSH